MGFIRMDFKESEGVAHRPKGLHEVQNFVGVENVWITRVTLEDNTGDVVRFTVEIETVAELAKWSQPVEEILQVIVDNPTYENGDFEVVGLFETDAAAFDYAEQTYPKVDLKELIVQRKNEMNSI